MDLWDAYELVECLVRHGGCRGCGVCVLQGLNGKDPELRGKAIALIYKAVQAQLIKEE